MLLVGLTNAGDSLLDCRLEYNWQPDLEYRCHFEDVDRIE
jgi:hypothetical protein